MPDITNPPSKKKKKKNGSYLYYEDETFKVGTVVYEYSGMCFAPAVLGEHEMDDDSIVTVYKVEDDIHAVESIVHA